MNAFAVFLFRCRAVIFALKIKQSWGETILTDYKEPTVTASAALTEAIPDFTAPVFFDVLKQLRGHEAGSYLMALAALCDGVESRFFRSQQDAQITYPLFDAEYNRPVFQSLSFGQHRRYFVGSQSDTVSPEAALNSRDKLRTKKILHRNKLATPFGGGASADHLMAIQEIAKAGIRRVVVKPIAGSQAKGVVLNLTPRAAAEYVVSRPSETFIVEQQIIGREYRVYVAGNRMIGAFARTPQHVVGDGSATIQALMQAKAESRLRNPYFNSRPLDFAMAERVVQRRNDSMDRVPAHGEVVGLAADTLMNEAGDRNYATNTISKAAADLCVAATKAMGLVAAGVDVMLDQRGVPYVLEVNVRAMISLHCFPHPIGHWNLELPRGIIRSFLPIDRITPRRVIGFDYAALKTELFREGRAVGGVNAADFASFG